MPGCAQALRLMGSLISDRSLQLAMLLEVFEMAANRFDIVHSHIDYWSFPFAQLTGIPTVSTMHGRLDIPDLHPVYHRFPDAALVSISDSQRAPLPQMNWVGTGVSRHAARLLRFNGQNGNISLSSERHRARESIDVAIEVALDRSAAQDCR